MMGVVFAVQGSDLWLIGGLFEHPVTLSEKRSEYALLRLFVDIDVIKPGMVIVPFRSLALTTADSSLPVSQLADRNYL